MTTTEDPRDILLWPDGILCFREECAPELLLRGGNYRVINRTSLEWYSRARRASQTSTPA